MRHIIRFIKLIKGGEMNKSILFLALMAGAFSFKAEAGSKDYKSEPVSSDIVSLGIFYKTCFNIKYNATTKKLTCTLHDEWQDNHAYHSNDIPGVYDVSVCKLGSVTTYEDKLACKRTDGKCPDYGGCYFLPNLK